MNRSFRKNKRRKERSREQRNKFFSLPTTNLPTKNSTESLIPLTATVIDSNVEPELTPLRITFESYDDRLCQIANLGHSQSRNVVKAFRGLGSCRDRNDFLKNNIQMIPVINGGEYKTLFRNIGDGVDVFEHKIDRTSRIFYSVLFPESLCRIIAVTSSRHFETKKQRG